MRSGLILFFWAMYTIVLAQGDPYRYALDPLGPGQEQISSRHSQLHGGLQPFVQSMDTAWFNAQDTASTIIIRPNNRNVGRDGD